MKFNSLGRTAGFAACLTIGSAAHAEIVFHGFGQVVGGSALDNNKTIPYLDYQGDPSFRPESLFALQVSTPLTHQLSATAQLVARGYEDFQPKFAWAYVSWQFDEHWQLRGGRQRIPFFRYSDYLEVGQAYPWIRPPLSVYNLGVDNLDGVNLSSNYDFGNWNLQSQLIYGDFKGNGGGRYNNDFSLRLRNAAGLAIDANYDDWLSLRVSYLTVKLDFNNQDTDNLDAALATAVPAIPEARADLATQGDLAQFVGVGFEINRNHWLLASEYTQVWYDHSLLPKSKGVYVTAGRHFGPWLPTLTWGRVDDKPSGSNALALIPAGAACTLPIGGVPTSVPGGCAAIASSALTAQTHQYHFYEIGLRYEISSNVAAKLDFTGFNSPVGGVPSANVLSAGITFTF